MSGVVLALDVGTRRVGVAVSDDARRMALPVETVDADDRDRIVEIIGDYDVAEIVVGWPLDMQGRERRAVDRVRDFVADLENGIGEGSEIPIHRWDERLTTTAADRLLSDADVTRRRRKEAVDQVAACQILEGYLAHRRGGGHGEEL